MPDSSAGGTHRISDHRQISALAVAVSKLRLTWLALSLATLAFLFSPAVVWAQGTYTETTLYSFCPQPGQNCPDGSGPQLATPVFDSQGNLYGTTRYGGANNTGNGCANNGCGTVFKLTPNGNGTWTESVLYSFCSASGCTDGNQPRAGLIIDSRGNLYGTTYFGGGPNNAGTVFELSPSGNGTWAEQVLYSFCHSSGCPDGKEPSAPLIMDAHGNLYGTTTGGGTSNQSGFGVVFELSPNGNSWNETVVYAFVCSLSTGLCPYGSEPMAGLTFDSAGNLYGTTFVGGVVDGANVYGTVFELSPSGGGWNETVLVAFDQTNGENPVAPVTIDSQGNLYGTTTAGGANQEYGGTVFELSPNRQGGWTEQILWNFSFSGILGYSPEAGLILDAHGNLYGNAAAGAGHLGAAFELSPAGSGQWTPTLLYEFCQVPINGGCGDGEGPASAMIFDAHGNLYGTAGGGIYGSDSGGVVYELTPAPLIPTTTVLTTAPNPSNLGQTVTMTATVRAQNGSLPTGTVVFESNGVQIGSASLNNSGVAVLNYANLPAGTDSIQAMYQGSPTLAPSNSNIVMQVVNRAASMTMVTSSPNPSTFGRQVTITATVSPSGPPAPTGTVGFTSNGTAISGCTAVMLNSGAAVCMTSTLAVGTDTIVATYSGDGNYQGSSGMLSQIVNPVPSAVQFLPITPCRIVDTRNPNGTFGGPPIPGHSSRVFPLSQTGNLCGIPSSAIAYSLNVTVIPMGALGYLTIWPTGEGQPIVSTLNSPDGRVKANAAIVPAGSPSGSVSVYVTNTTNVALDINGYFTAPGAETYQFYPLTPCRLIDTRGGQDGGTLQAGVERDYTMPPTCGIPSSATAYSFNVTVIPAPGGLDYLTVWPKGGPRPTVSTLNDNTGTVVANATIMPAGEQNTTAFYAHNNNTDLLLDVNGYFAAPGSGGYSFYVLTPCRAYDSRSNNGQPFMGERDVNIVDSPCGPPSSAQAYVFNATVVPSGVMPFLTLWPDGQGRPGVSTLNAYDGFVTSNMAIVPNMDGSIDAYAAGLTQLILDISGYFAP